MSNGYLIASDTLIDELQKNRYMKFEKEQSQDGLYIYTRMEYLNRQYQLLETGLDNFFRLTEYGICFFKGIGINKVYFSYFLLEKHFDIKDAIKNTCRAVFSKEKALSILLRNTSIELNKTYCVFCKAN